MIENQLPQIANLVAKGTLQVSVIYGKKLQGMVIKFMVEQQRINSDFVCVFFHIEAWEGKKIEILEMNNIQTKFFFEN